MELNQLSVYFPYKTKWSYSSLSEHVAPYLRIRSCELSTIYVGRHFGITVFRACVCKLMLRFHGFNFLVYMEVTVLQQICTSFSLPNISTAFYAIVTDLEVVLWMYQLWLAMFWSGSVVFFIQPFVAFSTCLFCKKKKASLMRDDSYRYLHV